MYLYTLGTYRAIFKRKFIWDHTFNMWIHTRELKADFIMLFDFNSFNFKYCYMTRKGLFGSSVEKKGKKQKRCMSLPMKYGCNSSVNIKKLIQKMTQTQKWSDWMLCSAVWYCDLGAKTDELTKKEAEDNRLATRYCTMAIQSRCT